VDRKTRFEECRDNEDPRRQAVVSTSTTFSKSATILSSWQQELRCRVGREMDVSL
jgi:hypothetical protein